MARPTITPHHAATLETPLTGLDSTFGQGAAADAKPLAPGTKVAEFSIVRLLGSGGGGRVYEATQECPCRQVALKVISGGHLAPALAGRFRFEAEALGRLRHPGIAQVIGAGFTDVGGGSAWIAMELVPSGRPLTASANAAGLAARGRVELFVAVCDAVAHAHARGVLHRDLKPGNVLVDDAGLPRLIDFGIALPVDGGTVGPQSRTLLAAGTPAYMSPEQFTGDADDLDLRADVYSLGVILYELLARRLPYDVGRGGILEVARAVSEAVPQPLPADIPRPLRGIVAKALAKDRQRRYASAGELAGELRRFLAGDPVLAVPPTAAEMFWRLFRRHRAWAAAIAFSLAAGVTAFAMIVWFAIHAARQRDLAEFRLKQAAAEQARAERATDFMLDTLRALDPGYEGPSLTTADVLAKMARRSERAGDDATRAAVLLTLGRGFIGVGRAAAAVPLLEEALSLTARVHGEDATATREAIEAARFANMSARNFKRACELWERELTWRRDNANDPAASTAAFMFRMANWLCNDASGHDRAVAVAREGAELAGQCPLTADRLGGQLALAATLENVRHDGEAAAIATRVVAGLTAGGEGSVAATERVELLHRAAWILRRIDPPAGLALHAQAVAESRDAFGAEDPRTLRSRQREAVAIRNVDGLERSRELFTALLDDQRRILGADDAVTISTQCELARVESTLGNHDQAVALHRDVLDRRRRLLGPDQPVTITTALMLARSTAAAGDLQEALRLAEDVAARRTRLFGPEHAATAEALAALAALRGPTASSP